MNSTFKILVAICTVLTVSVSSAQSLWVETTPSSEDELSHIHIKNEEVKIFTLDSGALQQNLNLESKKTNSAKNRTIIKVPNRKGKLLSFELNEKPVFSASLSEKYPQIKSYIGYDIEGTATKLYLASSPLGVQGTITYIDKPTEYIQKVNKATDTYVVYNKSDKKRIRTLFQCQELKGQEISSKSFDLKMNKSQQNSWGASDKVLRKFRIAISATSEYTDYHNDGNDTNGDAIADALAAINATLSRVNQIYETEMAITFELVDAPQLIFNDIANDPYSNGFALNDELQTTLTNTLGNAGYDIGHLFTRQETISSAGCLGCVCKDDLEDGSPYKGAGYTGAVDGIPEGDSFDISYVAHEIGHQMGANHTTGYSSEGTNVNSEPGSGSTIMAYAGATGVDDVQNQSDPYFHYHSIRQIMNVVTNSATCWQNNTAETLTNNPPVANAGNDFTIPSGTAYVLKGTATDVDSSDNLTFCWEQTDSSTNSESVGSDNFGPNLRTAPMNRSLPPSSSSDRYIPKFSSVLAGKTIQTNPTKESDWETVANVARKLNWALTVRDQEAGKGAIGQVGYDNMQITVENTTPFTVENPVSWAQETPQTIYWVVGSTNNATINCKNVRIKLSTDGGLTFPITIVESTPNDGSYIYNVPNIKDTNKARILVEAADNIFYDVSDFDFSINSAASFFINETDVTKIVCSSTSITYTFDFVTDNGYSENTVFSAVGNPEGTTVTFSPESLSTNGQFTMTIANISAQGNYDMKVLGTSSFVKSVDVALRIQKMCMPEVENDPEFKTGTTLVRFHTIDNATSKSGGYQSYHHISTEVVKGNSYDLTVHANTDGPWEAEVFAWVDWNKDCDFDDEGEFYDLGLAEDTPDGPPVGSPYTIKIPENAELGATVLRVVVGGYYGGDFQTESCDDTLADAEFEDYTLNVVNTASVENLIFDDFKIYPNSRNSSFIVNLTSSTGNVSIEVYDILGRKVYANVFTDAYEFNEEIYLNNVKSGMYIINVSDGVKEKSTKFIVE